MAQVDLEASLQGSSSLGAAPTVSYQMRADLLGGSALAASFAVHLKMAAALQGSSSLGASFNVVLGPAVPIQVLPTRVVFTGQPIFDQVDFFQGDGVTRQQGLLPADLTVKLFVGSMDAPWPIVSGVGVPDVIVSAGKVYFQEFEAGYYSFRFFPNMTGLWRIVLSWAAGNQGVSQSYDVQAKTAFTGAGIGLRSSFTKPPGMP